MKKEEKKYDVAVIGAGPAGMMAALAASGLGAKVVLIEKNSQLGSKILLTGNGRCNITNAEFNLKKLVENYPENGNFLFHAFSVFGPEQAINLFHKIGLPTKIEDKNRVFPKSNKAEDVVEVIKNHILKNGVEILCNTEVKEIVFKKNKIEKIVLDSMQISAKNYVLATGGVSYPQTGSTGKGHEFAQKLGHKSSVLASGLAPIIAKDEWIKDLQGLSLQDIKLNVFCDGRKQFSEEGDIIFTNNGISGPAAINASGRIGKLLKNGQVKIGLDLFPKLNGRQMKDKIHLLFEKNKGKIAKNVLDGMLAERLALKILKMAGIEENEYASPVSNIRKDGLSLVVKNIGIEASAVGNIEQAMVTSGGILLENIDHKTMSSKIVKNLFFAGEIMDIYGKTGGFNLQMCWSTGYLSGINAAK